MDGAPAGTIVTAAEQTAGRGRDGRLWHSPAGNLYLSAILRPDIPPARLPELSFVAALAVADTAAALLPQGPAPLLKWPNDVLVEQAKISGILIETAGDAVILGIGMNVGHHPAGLPYAATSLRQCGSEASVETARETLLSALAGRLQAWEAKGFAGVREAWMACTYPLGTWLKVTHAEAEGAFAGLDADGALLLDTPHGRRRVVAGDVRAA